MIPSEHVGDATGRAIERALLRRLCDLPNVTMSTESTAVDLITTTHHAQDAHAQYEPTRCLGAYVLDGADNRVHRILARETVLATAEPGDGRPGS